MGEGVVKWLGCEPDYSPRASADNKNEWNYTSASPHTICFHECIEVTFFFYGDLYVFYCSFMSLFLFVFLFVLICIYVRLHFIFVFVFAVFLDKIRNTR